MNPMENKAALLVVDAQESFKARGEAFWASGGPAGFKENIKTLVAGFRSAGLPVFFILHTDNDPGFALDSPYFRVMDELDPRPLEPIILKQAHNAFTGTPLLPMLIQRGINRLAVCGIRTEQCCETTTRVASDLGFRVDFVTEATLTFPLAHPNGIDHMTVAEIQSRTEMVLNGRFARIATVQEVLAGLEAA